MVSFLSVAHRGLSAAQATAALVVLSRLSRGRTRARPLTAAEGASDGGRGTEPITVVIPARDEATRLPSCLNGLVTAPGVLEVLVVDDGSADATADVAREHGARVITGAPLPDGWVGKPWALQQGLEAARGDVVVCLDADVRPDPGLPTALAARLAEADVDLLSGGVRFICNGTTERLLHPALLTTLMVRFGALDVDGYQPAASRALINGQCLAFVRAPFLAAGGFGRAADKMTDDVGLARAIRAAGGRLAFIDASALIEVRMYESARETWREWARRSLGLADVTSLPWQVADAATVTLVQALPVVRLLMGRPTRLDRGLLVLRGALLAAAAPVYAKRGLAFWCSPLADPAAAFALIGSVVAPRRTWRGRTYPPGRPGPLDAGRTGARSSS